MLICCFLFTVENPFIFTSAFFHCSTYGHLDCQGNSMLYCLFFCPLPVSDFSWGVSYVCLHLRLLISARLSLELSRCVHYIAFLRKRALGAAIQSPSRVVVRYSHNTPREWAE